MKAVMFLFVAFACAAVATAQPQIAVLKTSCSAGIDPTVAEPVTEKIIESIVRSGSYTVLDRLNVDKVLAEKDFQISSTVVSQAEMRRAGEYLGADYVLLASISRVGTTFILSAKVVDVTTGAISVQVSEERKGSIDVLLEAATVIGDRVAGTARAAAPSAGAPTSARDGTSAAAVVVAPAPGEAETAMSSIFGIRTMLDKQVFMKEAGALEVAGLASSLDVADRAKLYTSYRMGFPLGYSLLNIVPSLGSWMQGDSTGALVTYAILASGPLIGMATGLLLYDPNDWGPSDDGSWMVEAGLGYGSVVALALNGVFSLVRPWLFAGTYNRMLSRALLIVDASPSGGLLLASADWTGLRAPSRPGIGVTLLRFEY